jgi:alkylation response protein AidB-like acyl-CoA dehydrogenase
MSSYKKNLRRTMPPRVEHGGYDRMTENPIACRWIDTRVERIHAGANEIMMEMTGSSR